MTGNMRHCSTTSQYGQKAVNCVTGFSRRMSMLIPHHLKMANITIPLPFCTYNMHGFKTGFNTLKELCNSCDLIAVQEHWLRKDNMSNLAIVNSKFAHYGVSGMVEAASSGLLRGRPFGVLLFYGTQLQ